MLAKLVVRVVFHEGSRTAFTPLSILDPSLLSSCCSDTACTRMLLLPPVVLLSLLPLLTPFEPLLPRRSLLVHGAAAAAATATAWRPLSTSALGGRPSSLKGATVVITAGHQGLGLEIASRVAEQGARVVITARKQWQTERGVNMLAATVPGSEVIGLGLDLANLTAIREFPATLAATLGDDATVDVLVANAQGESPFNSERTQTIDGFERNMGVSHLGHFALFCELLPSLRAAAERRSGFTVISISSDTHRDVVPGALFYALDSELALPADETTQFERFRYAKVANVLFTAELARRLEAAGVRGSAVAVGLEDPRIALVTPTAPTASLIASLAAADADWDGRGGDRGRQGALYVSSVSGKIEEPSAAASNPRFAKRLWELSERLTGETARF